jgi:demethylmenaquinone methyltransferase/2-methoxy-6-polyprenyl-1,4-benzoquinol methylase
MANFDHFNFIGPIYDRIFGRTIDHEIVKLVAAQEDHAILDVGGGTGRVTVLLKDKTKRLFVVDSAIRMLQEAQEKGITCVNSSSELLPFKACSFDRIIMVDALHHVEDQQQTLNEMWRLLSPGGLMIIEEPDIHNFVVKLIALGEKLLLMRSHFLTPKKIIEMCQFDHEAMVELHSGNGINWFIVTRK